MATYYSQGSGAWSALANWDTVRGGGGSAPASVAAMNDQTFVIQPGHVITFDVEDAVACDGSVSGWTTGLAAVTIEGTTEGGTPGELTLSRVNNSANRVYHLAIKNGTGGTIAGTNTAVYGKFSSGTGATATTPMPTGAMHVIQQYGTTTNTALVNCTYLDVAMYAAEPVQTSYILSAGVTTSATALPVTVDPAAEVEWRAGWAVRIDDWGKQDRETTTATLHAATPVGTNVISLSGAIGVAKNAGARVVLCQRNIEFRYQNGGNCFRYGAPVLSCSVRCVAATATGSGLGYCTGCEVLGSAVISGGYYGLYSCTGCEVLGSAVISGCNYGLNSCTGGEVLGSAVISGCSYGLGSCTGCEVLGSAVISGCYSGLRECTGCEVLGSAVISGCYSGLRECTGCEVLGSAVISGCSYGLGSCTVTLREDAILTGNTYDVRLRGGTVVGYGVSLASAIQAYEYTGTGRIGADCENTLVLWSNGGVGARYPKFWCAGGSGDTNAVTCPPGHTESCAMLCEDAGWDTYLDIPIWAEGGVLWTADLWLRKTVAGMTSTPSVRILDPAVDQAGTPLAEVTMTDAVDTWENLSLSFTPTVSGQYTMRVRARNASGTVYWAHTVLTAYPDVESQLTDALTAYGALTDTTWTDAKAAYLDAAVTSREASGAAASALTSYDPPTKAELDSAVSPLATSASIVALNDLSAAEVNAEVDTALADYDPPTNAEMLAAIAALNDLSAVEAQAAVAAALAAYDAANGTDIAGVAASVWTYATRTITSWNSLIASISESALAAIANRNDPYTMYYGDNSPITFTVQTVTGDDYDLTDADITFALTESENGLWSDAVVTCTTAAEEGVEIGDDPTAGVFTVTLTDAQLSVLTPGVSRWYTVKIVSGDLRQTLLKGTWSVQGAADAEIAEYIEDQ